MAVKRYAVLGATGNCGSALIQALLQRPDVHIHAYCRDKTKLQRQLSISEDDERLGIFQGSLGDTDLLQRCLRDCHAAFLCVATNDNIPGTSLTQITAKAVVQALRLATTDVKSTVRLPKVVLLSSGTVDEQFARHIPTLLLPILLRSESYVYEDLKQAEKFLRSQADWITTIYMKPGALAVDEPRGYALSLTDSEGPIAYRDLAAAMIEAVDDPDGSYDQKSVSTICTNGPANFPPGTPLCILTGLLRHYFPWLHPYLPLGTGPK